MSIYLVGQCDCELYSLDSHRRKKRGMDGKYFYGKNREW